MISIVVTIGFIAILIWDYMPDSLQVFTEKYNCGEAGSFIIAANGLLASVVSMFVVWKFMKVDPSHVPLHYNRTESSTGGHEGMFLEERQEFSIADCLTKRSGIYRLNLISFGAQGVTFVALLLEVS